MSEPRYYNPVDNPVEYKLQTLIFIALGEASVGTWDPTPAGKFMPEKAKVIGTELVNDIIDLIRKK